MSIFFSYLESSYALILLCLQQLMYQKTLCWTKASLVHVPEVTTKFSSSWVHLFLGGLLVRMLRSVGIENSATPIEPYLR